MISLIFAFFLLIICHNGNYVPCLHTFVENMINYIQPDPSVGGMEKRSERTDWGFAPDVFPGSIMSNQNKEVLYIRIVTMICLFFGLLGVILDRLSGSVSMLFAGLYSLSRASSFSFHRS